MSMNWVNEEVEAHFEEIVAFRRHIHQNPELSFQEFQTAAFIEQSIPELAFSRLCETGLTTVIEPEEKS